MLLSLIASFALAAGATITPAPAPAAPYTVTINQSSTGKSVTFDQAKPLSISTPDAQGKVTVTSQDAAPFVFPNKNQLTVTYRGSPPKCPASPPKVTRTVQCTSGTEGPPWTQTRTYVLQPAPQCWQPKVPEEWLPSTQPSTCEPVGPPPGGALSIDLSFVDKTSSEYAAFLSFANRTDEADPQTLVYAYKTTGTLSYCSRAIPIVADWMADPSQFADDSYLQVDQYIAPAMMVASMCPNVTPAQKSDWIAKSLATIDALWARGCGGWAVCDLQNNYHAHFVRATVYAAIASGDSSRIAFAFGKFNEQLAALNAGQPNGGSLEGKGYQYAWKWLNDAALVARDSGFGDIFNANPYLGANTREWVHATTPDMQHFAPIGSQPRDSAAGIYDYQAGSVREGCYLTNSSVVKQEAGWWTAKIPLQFYRSNTWDDMWTCPAVATPPVLVYNASHVAIYARTAWAPSATYLVAVTYDRSQSHAHSEFGEVMYWRNGGWLAVAGQSLTHSGINGEPPDSSTRIKNVVGFRRGASWVRPVDGFPVVTNYSENQQTGAMHATLDMSANYAGMGVTKWARDIDFASGVATITDTVILSDSSLTAGQQWIVPGSSAPAVSGQVITTPNGRITVVQPSPATITVDPLTIFGPDFDRGGYLVTIRCNGGCQTKLSQ